MAIEIKLKNTLSGEIEVFKPIKDGEVSMYHCGPTVYSRAHIGNLVSYVFADTIRRTFEANGYKVKQVINITDVGHLVSDADDGDDKIEKVANQTGRNAYEISREYEKLFLEDIAKMNIETSGTFFPRATEHIKEQVALIEKLEKKGFTYKTSDGIYFDTSKFPNYGKLGNINIAGLEEGARIETNIEKKNKTDFALWKFSGAGSKRMMEWDSPWGVGFPGWHIECSAMSEKYLGQPFDIHTGGIDHIPVHHNNEIAQSEAANEKPLANYWLHNNHLTVDGQKISKSLGNNLSIDEILAKGYSPEHFRYFLLQSHYSSTFSFTWEALEASRNAFSKLVQRVSKVALEKDLKEKYLPQEEWQKILERFVDNFDTPGAIALLWDTITKDSISPEQKSALIIETDKILGLKIIDNLKKLHDIPEDIISLSNVREIARQNQDFKKSDELRKKIEDMGFYLKDTPDGPELIRRS